MKKFLIVSGSIVLLALSMFACTIDSQQRTVQSSDQQESATIAQQPLMQIDTTVNLYVFKPHFSKIELEVGQMPSPQNDSVIFCAAAAFTSQLKDTFTYDNIVGAYITHGKKYRNYSAGKNYGRFIYANGNWHFAEAANHKAVDDAVGANGCMFTQWWVIKDNEIYQPYAMRNGEPTNVYRAICEKDGELMIAQGRKAMPYLTFVQALKAYGIKNALYMDMGTGWNHSFYRDSKGKAHTLFPHAHNYCTNWITFYK